MATMSMKYQHGVMKTRTNKETTWKRGKEAIGMFGIQTLRTKKRKDSTQETATKAKGMRY